MQMQTTGAPFLDPGASVVEIDIISVNTGNTDIRTLSNRLDLKVKSYDYLVSPPFLPNSECRARSSRADRVVR